MDDPASPNTPAKPKAETPAAPSDPTPTPQVPAPAASDPAPSSNPPTTNPAPSAGPSPDLGSAPAPYSVPPPSSLALTGQRILGTFNGHIVLGAPANQSVVASYRLHWGASPTIILGTASAAFDQWSPAASTTYDRSLNAAIPSGAHYILGLSVDADGVTSTIVAAALTSVSDVLPINFGPADGLSLGDTAQNLKRLSANATITLPAGPVASGYELLFVDKDGEPVPSAASVASGVPSAGVVNFTYANYAFTPAIAYLRAFATAGGVRHPVSDAIKVKDFVSLTSGLSSSTRDLDYTDARLLEADIDALDVTFEAGSTVKVGDAGGSTIGLHSSRFTIKGSSAVPTHLILENMTNGDYGSATTPSYIYSEAARAYAVAQSWAPGHYAVPPPAGIEAITANDSPQNIEIHGNYYNGVFYLGSSANDHLLIDGGGTSNAILALLGGDDDVEISGAWKFWLRGGTGVDFFKGPIAWETRFEGNEGDDLFVIRGDTGMTPNNSNILGGEGHDTIHIAPVGLADPSAYVVTNSNVNDVSGDDGNDNIVFANAHIAATATMTMTGNAGDDSFLFKPLSVKYSSNGDGITLSGGAGRDLFYYHGAVERRDAANAAVGTILERLGTTNFTVTGFEEIALGPLSVKKDRTHPIIYNNAAVVTLALSSANINALSSGGDHAGKLFVTGDTDGTDRVNLSGFAADNSCDVTGYQCFCASGACLVVKNGLLVSLDGTTYSPL